MRKYFESTINVIVGIIGLIGCGVWYFTGNSKLEPLVAMLPFIGATLSWLILKIGRKEDVGNIEISNKIKKAKKTKQYGIQGKTETSRPIRVKNEIEEAEDTIQIGIINK